MIRVVLAAAGLLLALGQLAGDAVARPPCHASVTLVDFGRVDLEDGGDITGRLTVVCDSPTRFAVEASAGYGSYKMRTMLGPKGRRLRYNLFVDAARRKVWGDGESAGTARIVGQSNGRKAKHFTIYGRLRRGQSIGSGRYHDTVKVSISR